MHQGQVLAEGLAGRSGRSQRDGAAVYLGKGGKSLMLRVDGINTFYGTSHILHRVSLEIGDGELVAVLGRNGAGKTTLLRSITGVNPPRRGVDRARWRRHHPARSRIERTHLGISYVPQGRQIIPDITVAENICVGAARQGHEDHTGSRISSSTISRR